MKKFTVILGIAWLAFFGGCQSDADKTKEGNKKTEDTVENHTASPPAAQGPIIGESKVDTNSVEIYRVAQPQQGETYEWNVIGGMITGGQGTPQITVQWGPVKFPHGEVKVITRIHGLPETTERITVVIDPDVGGKVDDK